MNLEHAIEALLFWKGEPMSLKELTKSLGTTEKKVTEQDIHEALGKLVENLKGRGIVLMANDDHEYMLGTSSEASQLIERLTKEELSRDLGKASLETLSIILYQSPIKRSQIDYIRGVNSTFILRNLLIRGLIDKKPAPDDNRTSIYSPSFKLLSHLGIAQVTDLPNFEAVKEEIHRFKNEQESEAAGAGDATGPSEHQTIEPAQEDTDEDSLADDSADPVTEGPSQTSEIE